MEENKTENKTNNKSKIIIPIVVVLLVGCALGAGYFLGTRNNDKENNNSNANNESNSNSQQGENEEELDLNSEIVSTLQGYVSIWDDFVFYKKSKATLDDLKVNTQYRMAFRELDNKGVTLSCNIESMKAYLQTSKVSLKDCAIFDYEIPEENLEQAMIKVLGSSKALDKTGKELEINFTTKWLYKDLSLQNGLSSFGNEVFSSALGSNIKYNKNKKMFVGTFWTEGGGFGDAGIYSKFDKATKKGKTIAITEKVIFVDLFSETDDEVTEYNVYSDYNHSTKAGTISAEEYEKITEKYDNMNDINNDIIDKFIDKAMTVIYTFEENSDGSYRFVCSEIKK